MHKSSSRFFVVSLVAAVLSTGCAHKGATPETSETAATTASVEAQRQTSEVDVTSSRWAKVDSGPLTVVGAVGVGRFDGEAVCYASAGAACGNASNTPAELGTQVFTCAAGQCTTQNGGRVEAGKLLCCGAAKGNGGKLRISYTK